MKPQALTKKEYWDSVLQNARLPRVNDPSIYNYRVTMDFIHDVIEKGDFKTLLEVGCGSSGWLPYFVRRYNLTVSGIDYSEVGCRIAEENLKILKLKYDTIMCEDIFQMELAKKYDIIFSYGVIEHFEMPEDVVRILVSLLNENGIVITVVPNLNGVVGLLSKIFTKNIYQMHKIISKNDLINYHEHNALNNLKTEYVGNLTLSVIPWIKSNNFIFKENSFQRRVSLKFVVLLDRMLSSIYRKVSLQLNSKYLSPYIISISKKR